MKTGIVAAVLLLAAFSGCDGQRMMCDCSQAMFGLRVKPLDSCDSARLANLTLHVHRTGRTDTLAANSNTLCTWYFITYASMYNQSVDLVESTQVIATYPVQSTLHENDGCCGDYPKSHVVIPGGVDTVKGLVLW